jgi:hypothetical protein
LIPANRTAHDAAELTAVQLRLGCRSRREVVALVQLVAPDVIESRATEAVRAGFELQLHVGAGVTAVLRRVVRRLHLELFDRVDGGIHEQVVSAVVQGADAVEGNLLIHAARPAGAELCSGCDDASRQVAEGREVAAAQWQVDQRFRGHDVSGHAALRFEEQALRDDIDDLADLPDLEDEIQARELPHAQ